ncbi:uncharacterized protein OCT59_026290 [Rhizophagus irregularis]|uniref:uncharacterized protein n=1 Tax=Rhizophagus irregularis TaxID=588596 RepID=UPI0033244D43|nr:hypothetical protein OCT59_026290 [Rhizophagus irregularis]
MFRFNFFLSNFFGCRHFQLLGIEFQRALVFWLLNERILKVKEADRLSYRRQKNLKLSSEFPNRRFAAFQRNFEGFHDFPIAYLDRISKPF